MQCAKPDCVGTCRRLNADAVLAAVAMRVPPLRPLVQWAYGAAGSCTSLGLSRERRRCHGSKACARTTRWAVVNRADAAGCAGPCAAGRAGRLRFAVTNDVCVLGPVAARVAFASLRDNARGVGAVGLGVELGKSGVYGPTALLPPIAFWPWASATVDVLMVAGTPVGSAAFVEQSATAHADIVVSSAASRRCRCRCSRTLCLCARLLKHT
jgi:hypothetical protein